MAQKRKEPKQYAEACVHGSHPNLKEEGKKWILALWLLRLP